MTKEEEHIYHEWFEILDYDKQGLVDPQELIAVMKGFSIDMSCITYNVEWEVDSAMLYSAIVDHLAKEDYKNGMTYPQFLSVFTSDLVGNHTREQVMGMFRFLDETGTGTIKLDDMKRLVKDIGESVTVEELREIIRNATGGDAEISFEEFFTIFKKPTQ